MPIYDRLMADGRRCAVRSSREAEVGAEQAMREIERQVMLRILDTSGGVNTSTTWTISKRESIFGPWGRSDPLTEWQREGFEMFGELMGTVSRDFVKYVMHVQVVVNEPAPKAQDVQTLGPESPHGQAAPPRPAAIPAGPPRAPAPNVQRSTTPIVKTAEQKLKPNDPCHCGSGNKFKKCHGSAANR